MPFLVLIIASVLLVAAVRNTHGQLLSAIKTDVPAFAIWAAAIFGVGVIGFVPGLKPVSRGLLALLIVVIVLTNYQKLLGAFTGVAFGAQAQAQAGGSGGTMINASGGGPDPGMVDRLLSLVGNLGSGASADYSDFFGGPSVSTDNSAALASATAADDTTFKSSQRSAQRAASPVETSELVIGGANPISAAVNSVVNFVAGVFGPLSIAGVHVDGSDPRYASVVSQADPLGTAGGHQWQLDTFAAEAANLAAGVASGSIRKDDPGYQSKLDYLANLTGGSATSAAEMAKLRALGL